MNQLRHSPLYPLVAIGFVILVVVGSLCSQARADHTAVAQGWIAAWNSHDPDAVTAVFTDEAFYEDVALGSQSHGTAEIRAFAEFFFTAIPDLEAELVTSTLQGGHGTIEWIFSGTDVGFYATGKPFVVRGVTVIEVEGKKISRNSDYYSMIKFFVLDVLLRRVVAVSSDPAPDSAFAPSFFGRSSGQLP